MIRKCRITAGRNHGSLYVSCPSFGDGVDITECFTGLWKCFLTCSNACCVSWSLGGSIKLLADVLTKLKTNCLTNNPTLSSFSRPFSKDFSPSLKSVCVFLEWEKYARDVVDNCVRHSLSRASNTPGCKFFDSGIRVSRKSWARLIRWFISFSFSAARLNKLRFNKLIPAALNSPSDLASFVSWNITLLFFDSSSTLIILSKSEPGEACNWLSKDCSSWFILGDWLRFIFLSTAFSSFVNIPSFWSSCQVSLLPPKVPTKTPINVQTVMVGALSGSLEFAHT